MPRRCAAPRISPYVLCCCSRHVPAAIAATVLTTLLQIDELMSGWVRFIKTTNALPPSPTLPNCPRRVKELGRHLLCCEMEKYFIICWYLFCIPVARLFMILILQKIYPDYLANGTWRLGRGACDLAVVICMWYSRYYTNTPRLCTRNNIITLLSFGHFLWFLFHIFLFLNNCSTFVVVFVNLPGGGDLQGESGAGVRAWMQDMRVLWYVQSLTDILFIYEYSFHILCGHTNLVSPATCILVLKAHFFREFLKYGTLLFVRLQCKMDGSVELSHELCPLRVRAANVHSLHIQYSFIKSV